MSHKKFLPHVNQLLAHPVYEYLGMFQLIKIPLFLSTFPNFFFFFHILHAIFCIKYNFVTKFAQNLIKIYTFP